MESNKIFSRVGTVFLGQRFWSGWVVSRVSLSDPEPYQTFDTQAYICVSKLSTTRSGSGRRPDLTRLAVHVTAVKTSNPVSVSIPH